MEIKESYFVSIVIPCYNAEQFINKSVKSLVSQKEFDKCEVIFIDDCSTDDTYLVLKSKLLDYANIKILKNDINRGVSYTRNIGIKNSTGKYLLFFDSDDILIDGTIRSLYRMSANNFEMISFGFTMIENEKKTNFGVKKFNNNLFTSNDFLKLYFQRKIFQHICSFICLREIIVSNNLMFNESTFYAEDQEFQINCIDKVQNIKYLSYEYFQYIRNDSSAMSTKFNSKHLTGFDVFQRLNPTFSANKNLKKVYSNFVLYYYYSNYFKFIKSKTIAKTEFDNRANPLTNLKPYFIYNSKLSYIVLLLHYMEIIFPEGIIKSLKK